MRNHHYSVFSLLVFFFLGGGGGWGGVFQTTNTKILDYIGVVKHLLKMDKKHTDFPKEGR